MINKVKTSLLIDFLNQLLPPQHQIAVVSFKNPENMSDFDIAEMPQLSSDQYDAYLKNVLSYNEAKAITDTAFYDGKIDVAKMMLAENFDVETIVRLTKLTVQQIEALR